MREVSAEDEKDLTDVTVDETIFDDVKEAAIKIFPIIVAGELNLAISGTTYPFKDILKKHGFAFNNIVNDQPGREGGGPGRGEGGAGISSA